MSNLMPMAIDNQKIQSTIVVMKKTEKEYNDPDDKWSGLKDTWGEIIGQKISFRLISADKIDPDPKNIYGGKIGPESHIENWNQIKLYGEGRSTVTFGWNEEFGTPGAILVKNPHDGEFYLKTVTLEDVPGRGPIHFICNSWVYNEKTQGERIFFASKAYLPYQMPEPLRKCTEEELRILRGNGEGELKEWDRVYDYALYNDLGDPDKDLKLSRPVLGGSATYPYPRRGRTSRPPSKKDHKTESRNFPSNGQFNIYVPKDEEFSRSKKSDFKDNNLRGQIHALLPGLDAIVDEKLKQEDDFDSFEEVDTIYFDETSKPLNHLTSDIFKSISRTSQFPRPQVIKADKNRPPTAWRTNEEFAREMLAGVNPVLISLLKEFPPASKLDSYLYGQQHSSITKKDIEHNLDGLSVEEAMRSNRLFILDHHDTVMPYLRRINQDTSAKTYASRTLLFLRGDGTLNPVAIELSLPHPEGDKFGVVSKVYTPAEHGIEGSLWQLAKAYVAVVDTGHHQLISHWLNTHAAMEPFVIATNRQLSVVHPIYKLLHPHFRYTMTINALARELLVNAGGVIEKTFYPGKYSMEMSSVVYKSWNFLDQALPNDLKKRGIAVDDVNSKHGLKLLIKDYPYAVDGLKIWFAIEKWVRDYCSFYYKTDKMVQQDPQLQAWWKELREVGHGDKKDEPWWPKMQTREELIESCTIIIWIASALHAAVNFGQYAYGGYFPNRPTLSRKFMPEKGTPEYAELETNFEKVFLGTMTSQLEAIIVMATLELLSDHASDEEYLGQRTDKWTTDAIPAAAFEAFQKKLAEIEEEILKMNMDKTSKNRVGPVNVPYTLLYPTGEAGLSGKGIPNSISI
ncbi:hypothetical protein REPUB_Repub16aG0137300 [Reevesia pubescens]